MPAIPQPQPRPPAAATPEVTLPLDLGLNDGTYAPQACVEALRRFDSRTSFRNYTSANNDPLRRLIARVDGVTPEHVFLHNGSGPILKLGIPLLLKQRVLASPRRILRHALTRAGYPIITPRFTYSKVPKKAAEGGMRVHMLPLAPANGFALDLADLGRRLARGDGLVYLVNPNNPTGNLLVDRPGLIGLLEAHPESRFWIDEAYVQYVDPALHPYAGELVPRFPNLLVGRSLSFAYGLAGIRVGYLLAHPDFVRTLEAQVTEYRLGCVQESVAIAALEDEEHLPFVREATAAGRRQLSEGLARRAGIECFPSQANFVLCRRTDGRTAKELASQLKQRKISIKVFEPANGVTYEPYFRVTVGLPHENDYFLKQVGELLADAPAGPSTRGEP